jgi:hypothetical protein
MVPLRDPCRDEVAAARGARIDDEVDLAQTFPNHLVSPLGIATRVLSLQHVAGEDTANMRQIETAEGEDLVTLHRIERDSVERAVDQPERAGRRGHARSSRQASPYE